MAFFFLYSCYSKQCISTSNYFRNKKTIVVENPFNAVASKPTTVVIYNGQSIYRKENTVKVFTAADQYEHQATAFSDHLIKKIKLITT